MVTIKNPIIWSDFPDNDIVRDGNAFYMVTTSMHSMPGGPILKSYDLKNWEIVSYMFERLNEKDANNLENGQHIYGKGSWAASLRKVGEYFYCLFNCNDDHHAYICRTDNPEKTGWEKYSLPEYMHDPSFLIDDDGRKYVLYGNNEIHICELNEDMLSVREGSDRILFVTETENIGLRAEGCHAYKIDGHYYAIFIEWPRDGHQRRREVCYRWDSFEGPFEHKVILDDDMGYHNAGVAQGAIFTLPDEIDSTTNETAFNEIGPEGRVWASVMFQDHGAVGRIPYILPVQWRDGWPMLGIDGRVPEEFVLPISIDSVGMTGINEGNVITAADLKENRVCNLSSGDSFKRLPGEERLLTDVKHLWQWNHNPDDAFWSLDEHPGYLRLINGHICEKGVLQARNTLTQRTFGPMCTATTHILLDGLQNGDCCGMTAIEGQFGIVGVRVGEDGDKTAVMCVNDGSYGERVIEEIEICSNDIYLKIAFDFRDNIDLAEFFISFDGENWRKLGDTLQMRYTLDHFMGCRVGLYSYCTEKTGGFADFEYFSFE